METEYARIIREAVAYAESYAAKGFTFVWDDSLEFSWESGAGWMGTPRVKYEGVDGTIEMLKYHIDKIVKTSTDPGNGVPAHSAHYKVMQVMVDGDTAFVVLYGYIKLKIAQTSVILRNGAFLRPNLGGYL